MIVPLEAALEPALYGGKAHALGAALRAGLPVPRGHAVSVAALSALARGDAAVSQRVRALVDELGLPLAARSSAVGEDGQGTSFAGQHLTRLNVTSAEQLIEALLEVRASAHTNAALAYRSKLGVTAPVEMAAVVQRLVAPDCAGVLFTRNPVTLADERVIEAAWGLGEAVVMGIVTPDHFRLARDGRVLEARLGDKDVCVTLDLEAGGTQEVPLPPERANALCLDAIALSELSELAARCEAYFGPDLDLEWGRTPQALYLLQSRPITTARK
jgi:pyruvate, water dikinase